MGGACKFKDMTISAQDIAKKCRTLDTFEVAREHVKMIHQDAKASGNAGLADACTKAHRYLKNKHQHKRDVLSDQTRKGIEKAGSYKHVKKLLRIKKADAICGLKGPPADAALTGRKVFEVRDRHSMLMLLCKKFRQLQRRANQANNAGKSEEAKYSQQCAKKAGGEFKKDMEDGKIVDSRFVSFSHTPDHGVICAFVMPTVHKRQTLKDVVQRAGGVRNLIDVEP